MVNSNSLVCPSCNGNSFLIKHQATYVYSYVVDSDAPGLQNTEEFLPFMFDNREQKETKQYLECKTCGTQYPCYFDEWDKGIGLRTLQEAISKSPVSEIE